MEVSELRHNFLTKFWLFQRDLRSLYHFKWAGHRWRHRFPCADQTSAISESDNIRWFGCVNIKSDQTTFTLQMRLILFQTSRHPVEFPFKRAEWISVLVKLANFKIWLLVSLPCLCWHIGCCVSWHGTATCRSVERVRNHWQEWSPWKQTTRGAA